MTIQDDKQYSLSGGQWKDLVARLSEGAIVQLTTDDYNYPTTEPNCIAPWLLPDGIYFSTSEVAIKPDLNQPPFATEDSFIIRSGTRCFMAGPSHGGTFSGHYSNGTLYPHEVSGAIAFDLLNVNAINNNLTTTTSGHVLDARQGKALKDTIDSLGTIKTLTTADYNYPTTGTKTGVATYLLNPGFYKIPVGLSFTNGTFVDTASSDIFCIVNATTNSKFAHVVVFQNNSIFDFYKEKLTGATFTRLDVHQRGGSPVVLSGGDVKDTLNSSSTQNPLSAKQGKVLNDKIGDLSTLTTTDKSSAVAAINEIVTSIGNVESALNVINNGEN